ncbi:ficolin-3-like [Asterias rubens]|uniref:ficolin-3-like n=1 Tax=Asterias rubens TaxID=7604 RepID=UPI00145583BC|nr:ficolin-3-like [Asterias rubens]
MGEVRLMTYFHCVGLLVSLLMLKQARSFGSLCSGLKHQFYHSAENKVLKNYVQKWKTVANDVICGRDCSMDEDCKSFNFYECKKLCELNNATRAGHLQDFLEDQGSVYFDEDEDTTHYISTESTTAHSISPLPKLGTCKQLLNTGNTQSKVYPIYPGGSTTQALQVYCDMETDGGGWTVFQRRLDGSVDFDRNWAEYKSGFGDPSGEYWLGNDILVALTSLGSWDLRVDLEGWDGQTAYAKYQYASIIGENYKLNLGTVTGPAGGSLPFGQPFTTRDKDNDNVHDKNCAEVHRGAWWFNYCSLGLGSNLNGVYHDISSISSAEQGIWWETFKREPLKTSSMKLREIP